MSRAGGTGLLVWVSQGPPPSARRALGNDLVEESGSTMLFSTLYSLSLVWD